MEMFLYLRQLPLEKVVLAIACTKLDLESARSVSHARALSYAREVGASLFETSARGGHGVDELFHRVTEEVHNVMLCFDMPNQCSMSTDVTC